MTARRARRAAIGVVAALGLTDVVLAASPGRPGRIAWFGPLRLSAAIGGPRYALLVAGTALLATVPSLRAAKRNAWRVAIAVATVSLFGHRSSGLDAAVQIGAMTAVAALAATRRQFAVPSDPLRTRRGWMFLAGGELAVLTYGVGGLFLLDSSFRRSPSFPEAVEQGLRLLLLLPASVRPATWHGAWFIDSVRFLSVGMVLAGLGVLLRANVASAPRNDIDRLRVERILRRWGTSALGPFHLLDDKTWFFASDGDAFLSYKITGRVAVVLGGPVGPAASRAVVTSEFLERCHLNGWVPAFHQVSDDDRDVLEARGLRLLKIGEEALVEVQTFGLDGHGKKTMRSALRRVGRSGHRVEELAQPIDDRTLAELREVSSAWMAAGNHRERTFTVGQFDAGYLRSTPVVVVRDGTDRIVAFANILPSHASATGNFDLMRRRPDSVNGVMELLLVSLIARFRGEGKRFMTLGLAPLANLEGEGLPARALRLLRDHGGVAFSFSGLAEFKARWGPRWEPRYLAYPAQTDLPRVGIAVARAGELPNFSTVWGRAVSIARRYPFSTAFLAFQGWLMLVTSINPAMEPFLLRRFGVSWPGLVRGQWWRLATAPLVEPRSGVVWSNVLLLALIPAAERLFGSRRTLVAFFAGDWISTLAVLGALRVGSALGSSPAVVALRQREAGPSAAAFALLAASLAAIPHRQLRMIGASAVTGLILVPLALYTRVFDVEHLLAAAIGAGLALRWSRSATAREKPPVGPSPAEGTGASPVGGSGRSGRSA